MILCAGLGTRLKPWTERHPKALVPVGGIPMLKRVSDRLIEEGFDDLIINVYHFADQILDFVRNDSVLSDKVSVSDETDGLLDTGGGILNAEALLCKDSGPFLVHNVDILSNANLRALMEEHSHSGRHVSLLVSDRDSERKLVFDGMMNLKGWVNRKNGQYRPASLKMSSTDRMLSFSGIYVMDPQALVLMKKYGFADAFPIMDFFLAEIPELRIGGVVQSGLEIMDIGKPDTLYRADLSFQ